MKRVKCAGKVTEVILELPSGEEWIFAVDMAFMARLIEDGRELTELIQEFKAKPVTSMAEILYFGLIDRQPEVTRDDVRRRIRPSEELISAVMESFFSFFPEMEMEGANPTTPPMVRRRKKGRAG